MKRWTIANKTSGQGLGTYKGATRDAALNALAKDAGYKNYREACKASNVTVKEALADLIVVEVKD